VKCRLIWLREKASPVRKALLMFVRTESRNTTEILIGYIELLKSDLNVIGIAQCASTSKS